MKLQETLRQVQALWPEVEINMDAPSMTAEIRCKPKEVAPLCDWLFHQQNYHFGGLVVEENGRWELYYLFVGEGERGRIQVRTSAPLEERRFESVSVRIHAADWHEREAEDLFGLIFEGHPRLGDFILHDDVWGEGVEPMRKGSDPKKILSKRRPREEWRPIRIVDVPGAFVMPIGPVFSGVAESVHFQLETIGEEVLRAFPRLFFKYRGVEKWRKGVPQTMPCFWLKDLRAQRLSPMPWLSVWPSSRSGKWRCRSAPWYCAAFLRNWSACAATWGPSRIFVTPPDWQWPQVRWASWKKRP